MRAPRKSPNPFFWKCIEQQSKHSKSQLQFAAGFPYYCQLHAALHAERIPATPLTVARLQRVADLIGFPRDQIFLDDAR